MFNITCYGNWYPSTEYFWNFLRKFRGAAAAPRNLQSKFDFRKNTDQNDNSQLSVKQP